MDESVETSEFTPDLSEAVAAQSQIAIAPDVQEQAVVESTTTTDSLQTPVTPSWREQLGLPGLAELDDAAAIERVKQITQAGSQAYQEYQYELRQRQQIQNQNAQLQAQLQAIQQAQQASQPQVAAKPEVKLPWEPVQIDEGYLDWIDPATGQWRENTPHQVVIGYQKQQRALKEFQAKLYTKPHEVIGPMIEERAKALVTPLEEKFAALEQQYAAQQQQAQTAAMLAPFKSQFYAIDQYGQVQLDQFGRPVLTEAGQNFNRYTEIAHQMGFTDPQVAAAMGALATERDMLKAQLAQQPVQAAAAAVTPRQVQDQAIYANGKNGANRIANRGQTIAAAANPAAPAQNEHTSLEDELRQSYRQLVGSGLG